MDGHGLEAISKNSPRRCRSAYLCISPYICSLPSTRLSYESSTVYSVAERWFRLYSMFPQHWHALPFRLGPTDQRMPPSTKWEPIHPIRVPSCQTAEAPEIVPVPCEFRREPIAPSDGALSGCPVSAADPESAVG